MKSERRSASPAARRGELPRAPTSKRPAYPPAGPVLLTAVWKHVHDAVIGLAIVLALSSPYVAASRYFSERVFFTLSLVVAHSGTWLLVNGGLLLAEHLNFAPITRHKIERRKAEVASPALVRRLYLEMAFNHLCTTPLTAYLLFSVSKWAGMPAAAEALPSYASIALFLAASHSFNDWGFYWTHRLLHHRALYARFHKQHHEFKGTVGAAAEYAHPFEVVLSNQIPTLGFVLGVGAHPLICFAWLVLRLSQTYEAHSGYEFGDTLAGRWGLTSNDYGFHDHHHTVNSGNYGAEHMDWLFGTMDSYASLGGRKGYLKSRRADAGRAEAYPVKGD